MIQGRLLILRGVASGLGQEVFRLLPPIQMREEGDQGLTKLSIKIFVETLEEEEEIRRVWEQMLERSPLYRTFSTSVCFDLQLQIVM